MIELPTESEPVRIIQGDCLQVLRELPAGCVDAVVTDPPYGVGLGNNKASGGKHGMFHAPYASGKDSYEEFIAIVPPAIRECLRITDRAAVFTGPHIWEQPKASAVGGVYCPSAAGRHSWGFKNLLPVLFYGIAPDLHKGVKEPTMIRSTETAEKSDHPCPKPTNWMRWLVRLCTRPGEIVLDPFGGSGTTAAACIIEGRRCIIIEKEPAYVEIIHRRVAEAMGTGLLAGLV